MPPWSANGPMSWVPTGAATKYALIWSSMLETAQRIFALRKILAHQVKPREKELPLGVRNVVDTTSVSCSCHNMLIFITISH